jgi:Ca-activated chloride channel family protein
VLLVTVGEDLEGGGVAAARALGEEGVRIHALAVGTPAGELIPLAGEGGAARGPKKDRRGEPVVTRLDLAALREVTGAGGGQVFTLDSPDRGPAAIRPALDALEKGEIASRLTVRYEDRYALAAFPALLCLLASLLLGEARRRPPAGDGGEAAP